MKTTKHIIYSDSYNEDIPDFLKSKVMQQLQETVQQDAIIVLGGDGTMIDAIQEHHDKELPFLGLNFGHKGFLLNDVSVSSESEFVEKTYPLLEAELTVGDDDPRILKAINEINIQASKGKVLTLDIQKGSGNSISISGDGTLVSTPAGSTAYNRSLGGPIIPHNIPAFVVTPKAAWKPQGQSPIIISQDDVLNIQNSGRICPVSIYADSREVREDIDEEFEIRIAKSKQDIRFLVGAMYENTWDNKAMQEQGFTA